MPATAASVRGSEALTPNTSFSRSFEQARAATVPAAVDISGASLTFETADGKVEALSQVDLKIAAGDFVSLIGPSGCGKTTLLRIIADLAQPTEGVVLVNGVSPHDARVRRQYGYVFQAPALYPWRTVERNVMLPLEVMGYDAAERKARARRYLELVNRAAGAAGRQLSRDLDRIHAGPMRRAAE